LTLVTLVFGLVEDVTWLKTASSNHVSPNNVPLPNLTACFSQINHRACVKFRPWTK